MTVNKVVALTMLYIIGQFICLSFDGQVWGSASDPLIATLNALTGFDIMSEAGFSIIRLGTGIWNAMGKLVLWDYNFLVGGLFALRLVLFSITVGAIYGFAQFMRGSTS